MTDAVRVLVVGLGHMGASHLRAYLALAGFKVVGVCTRQPPGQPDIVALTADIPHFTDYSEALAVLRPDAVSINTWPDTHAAFARQAFAAGAHVFVEKPLADTLDDARGVMEAAVATGRKLVVGYILRHHPSWAKLVELARGLGKPLVMRMNLNQQSTGEAWTGHRNLMRSLSPIVDCGVHYVDMMCLMTGARPVRVHAIGARLTDDVAPDMYNYGQLQVSFDDGSVGWYEAAWGPMVSETAYFVKDVIGPRGSVSIVTAEQVGEGAAKSSDIERHTRTEAIRLHHAALGPDSEFLRADEVFRMDDEPGHDALCQREQVFFLDAIRRDVDLSDHMREAVESLAIVLAADQSIRTRQVVAL